MSIRSVPQETAQAKRKGTLRQEIIASAARSAITGKWIPTPVTVNAWLETSGAAACVAGDFGLTREGLCDRVDALDYTRLVNAISAEYGVLINQMRGPAYLST